MFHRIKALVSLLLALPAAVASADVYSDVAAVFATTPQAIRAWLPPNYAALPAGSNPGTVVLNDSPLEKAQVFKNLVLFYYSQQNLPAPTGAQILAQLGYHLDHRFESSLGTTNLVDETQRAITRINEYYMRSLGRIATDWEALYWVLRVAYQGLAIARYEIATSPEAGKIPVIDPKNLPLGDKKFGTVAKKGYLMVCDPSLFSLPHNVGAKVSGPWIGATTYDNTAKPAALGAVSHSGGWFSFSTAAGQLVFAGNGLPSAGILTGIYPVLATDLTWVIDGNPNYIPEIPVNFTVPLYPVADGPYCIIKDVGMWFNGVPITCPLDPIGNDEVAYEIQDELGNGAQPSIYHGHGRPQGLPEAAGNAVAIGVMADGFPISSSFDKFGKEIRTDDLDECHGTTSEILLNGQWVSTYHYVATRDYPYTISCFMAKPNQQFLPPLPPRTGN
jgi:hypothetical protein